MSHTKDAFDLYNPSESHQMLRDTIRAFVRAEVEEQALQYDREERFNLPLFRKLGDLGLLGITVPMDHGGSEMDAVAAVIAHEELSYADPGFALAYLAHSMLCVNNLAFNCNDEQKARFLPNLCSGEWVGAMGMSEPGAGTDVLGMKTQARRDGDDYILNGQKMWITNGCIDDEGTPCDVVLVYAKTGEENGRPQLSTFIVEKGMAGFSVGQKIFDKTGMRASNTAELVFEDVRIPAKNLLGEEGDSMIHMMRNLEIERLTLAAMSVGIARRCVEDMTRYANDRKAFGKPISGFGQIQRYIGDSFGDYRAAKAYVYDTAQRMNLSNSGNRLDSDGVKLVAAPMAKNVADRAMQVMGGYGYVGEYVVERLWRDAKLLEIGGGTLEAHQKNIARDLSRNQDLFSRL
ncbi:MAG: isovaleryl-CoA dehydrogenase [Myxococcales bacterium]|nr:isovaleryl-CoA dehydrogenase [Myxococcales bacterium]